MNSYNGNTRLFTICFSIIIVGLNQGPVSRKHANKQDSTCPELVSLKMLSILSSININRDHFIHTPRRPKSISCKYQNQQNINLRQTEKRQMVNLK